MSPQERERCRKRRSGHGRGWEGGVESQGFLGNREFGVWEGLWSNGELGSTRFHCHFHFQLLAEMLELGSANLGGFWFPWWLGKNSGTRCFQIPAVSWEEGVGRKGNPSHWSKGGFEVISHKFLWFRQGRRFWTWTVHWIRVGFGGWIWASRSHFLFYQRQTAFTNLCLVQFVFYKLRALLSLVSGIFQEGSGREWKAPREGNLHSQTSFSVLQMLSQLPAPVAVTLTKGFTPFLRTVLQCVSNLNFKCYLFFF